MGGNDRRVVFYHEGSGGEERTFSYPHLIEDDGNGEGDGHGHGGGTDASADGSKEGGGGVVGSPPPLSSDARPPPLICREFTVAVFNPTGEAVAVGNFDSLYVYSRDADDGGTWKEEKGVGGGGGGPLSSLSSGPTIVVTGMYDVTALAWDPNGSSLYVGTAAGLVDAYGAWVRRYWHKGGTHEVMYVSKSRVLIRDGDNEDDVGGRNDNDDDDRGGGDRRRPPVVLKTSAGSEIVRLSLYPDPGTGRARYAVARSAGGGSTSLLLCDMEAPGGDVEAGAGAVSEIAWGEGEGAVGKNRGGGEKFIFDSPRACIISRAGELSVVEVSRVPPRPQKVMMGAARPLSHVTPPGLNFPLNPFSYPRIP